MTDITLRPWEKAGFREGHDFSLACEHRDLSVCDDCAKHPNVGHVSGQHYWYDDPAEAAAADAESAAALVDWKARQAADAATRAAADAGAFWRAAITRERARAEHNGWDGPAGVLKALLCTPVPSRALDPSWTGPDSGAQVWHEIDTDRFWSTLADAIGDVDAVLNRLENL